MGEKNGWVTLKCFTGCEREEILAAMGLKLRDLALNERPDPKAQAEMERIRVKEATERKRIKANWRRVLEQAIYWRSRRDELGKLLHETPNSDKIASLFNAACYRAAHLSDSELHLLEKITWTTGLPFKTFNLSRMDGLLCQGESIARTNFLLVENLSKKR